MSAQAPVRRVTAPQIADRKGSTPIVALTAYTAPMAAMDTSRSMPMTLAVSARTALTTIP